MGKCERRTVDLRPAWAVEADKVMAERRITKKRMAEELHLSYSHICNVMTGVSIERSNRIRNAVCEYLGIKV